MSESLVLSLIQAGVLRFLPNPSNQQWPEIDPESLVNVVEGDHYVVCLECGEKLAVINWAHLRYCANLNQDEYLLRHPGAAVLSKLSSSLKARTDEQNKFQSDKLKARFKTPDGEITRKQMSDATIKMLANGGLERVTTQLRAMNKDPVQRAKLSELAKIRWLDEDFRDKMKGWRLKNPEKSKALAANARRYIKRKRTRLHAQLKEALLRVGLDTITEYEVGYYSIDEALPDLKISIEADGCYWHGCNLCGFSGRPETRRYDCTKESYLKNRGWVILHFPGHRILEDADKCAQEVAEVVKARTQKEAV